LFCILRKMIVASWPT